MSFSLRGRGITWKNPLVNAAVHVLNPLDYAMRVAHGRTHLPPFSMRVRSVGVRRDFGGAGFAEVGRYVAELMSRYASLMPESKVLEIGCGCGRNAFALADVLNDGNYTGMDIERVALDGAKANRRLQSKKFFFDFLDVRNDAYNPTGRVSAAEYVLPYADSSFDVVFLISVFTHMLTDEVKNYAGQIERVLKPGGRRIPARPKYGEEIPL